MKLSSYKTAFLTGAIWMPIFLSITPHIEKTGNSFLMVSWLLFGFLVPVAITTMDISYNINELKNGRSLIDLSLGFTKKDRKHLIQVTKRMLVWFVSLVLSLVILNLLNIKLS